MKMVVEEGKNNEMKFNETFFITHGNPILTVEDTHPLRPFFETWTEKIFSKKPKAILVISGHWETDHPAVNAVHINDTIYDFDDYPEAMYKFKYPAPGSLELAKGVQQLLNKSKFETVHIDQKRGLDHGVWVPLMYMYPEADIPVCQLSVQPKMDGTYHYNLGRALAPLRDEGILIIGSGSATHPLDETPHYHGGVAPWAAEFDSWLDTALTNGRIEEVNTYETKAPNWELAHPFPEHFYPLHVVVGAAGEKWKAELIHTSWDHGTLCHGAYKFTSS
ncbi:4,5-DOPA dioxygenase extradiol 1-like [Chenopodium quinoa]|uniref:4,5-DOPA dioxygenase extradiol 1-like n=1 Tax=Chenopodium quinoa TaxID=63459 RepID=UPI000B7972CD|nr:4,5-DOPA dioxygenase extradiol 1-like [Chenopodium quinoa]